MKNVLIRLLMLGLLLASHNLWAGVAGQVTNLSGVLSAKRADGSSHLLAVRSEVMEGDLLTTTADTYARIKFVDRAEVVLRPNSQLRVNAYSYNEAQPQSDNVLIGLLKGGLRALTGLIGKRNHDAVNFKTPTATIGIRGTDFGALYCNNDCAGMATFSGQTPENGLYLDVADGAIFVQNNAGQQDYAVGQFGFVRDATSPPVVIPPQQGVQAPVPPQVSQETPASSGVGHTGSVECVAQ
ncbi:MAG: FecR domain-containing protein [Sterolibacterium sp.]|jgi:hypothetical protein|nr:FecR domain-containing protein [Sterolibacterium sp.]